MKYFILFFLIILSSSCSSFSIDPKTVTNIFSNDYEEIDLTPKDSVQFQCIDNKNFYLKYLEEKNAVWITLIDREFRLEKIKDEDGSYANETTRLDMKEEIAIIKKDSVLLYDQCQKKPKGT